MCRGLYTDPLASNTYQLRYQDWDTQDTQYLGLFSVAISRYLILGKSESLFSSCIWKPVKGRAWVSSGGFLAAL